MRRVSLGSGSVSLIFAWIQYPNRCQFPNMDGGGGLVRSSVWYSRVTKGDGSGGVFKFLSTASSSGSTVGESG